MLLGIVLCVIGLVVLTKASDAFVDGASRLAVVFKMSPILIGAVVIGFGTSLPEMLVSAVAAGRGDRDLGVGNVIGSNVANLSLVLGAAALFGLITVAPMTRRREVPLSAAGCVLFATLCIGGLTRVDGAILVVALAAALGFLIKAGGAEDIDPEVAELLEEDPDRRAEAVRTVIGLVGTVLGAQLLVDGGLRVADALDLSEGFVGFSLVAIGTSLPELVTAVVAARKGATDLIVGNLLGSNLFNSLAVGGVVSLVGPGEIVDDQLVRVGLPIMLGVVALASLFMLTGRIGRLGAVTLLLAYLMSLPLVANDQDDESASSVTGGGVRVTSSDA